MCKCGCNKCDVKSNKKMKININKVSNLIEETIKNRIKMIDEAGDKAALKAKLTKIENEIREAEMLKNNFSSLKILKKYIDAKLISSMMEEITKAIGELKTTKEDLETKIVGKKEPKKEPKEKKQ